MRPAVFRREAVKETTQLRGEFERRAEVNEVHLRSCAEMGGHALSVLPLQRGANGRQRTSSPPNCEENLSGVQRSRSRSETPATTMGRPSRHSCCHALPPMPPPPPPPSMPVSCKSSAPASMGGVRRGGGPERPLPLSLPLSPPLPLPLPPLAVGPLPPLPTSRWPSAGFGRAAGGGTAGLACSAPASLSETRRAAWQRAARAWVDTCGGGREGRVEGGVRTLEIGARDRGSRSKSGEIII